MASLLDLPDVPLQHIFGYLTVNDVLNLKLTCNSMFESSRCKEFFGKVQICMSKIEDTDLEIFQKVCDEFSSNFRFNTEGCFEERFGWILPYIKNVKDILVNVRYLKQACMKVKYAKHLVINYIQTDGLNQSDIDFSCLSIAKELDQLSIKGSSTNFQKLYLLQSMLHDIIYHAKQISKISFDSIHVQGFKEVKDSLSKEFRKSSHINEWHLQNVVADAGIFDLPEDIRVLECRHTDCVSFKDSNFKKLEKLVLENIKFENKLFKFENLKILEITGHLRGEEDLDEKTVICPKLEILRLFGIYHIGGFKHLLTSGLKILHIDVINDINDAEKDWILLSNPLIKKFTYSSSFRYQLCLGTSVLSSHKR